MGYRIIILFFTTLALSNLCYADNFTRIKLGEVGPIKTDNTNRPLQYPFICRTQEAGLGNPVIDNEDELGTPVKDTMGNIIGYSENCGLPMRIDYFYKPVDKNLLLPLPANQQGYYYPRDVDTTAYGYKYIVRVERGTINRFMYMILVLDDVVSHKPPLESGYAKKLVFYFGGGEGLGHTQAGPSAVDIMRQPYNLLTSIDALTLGYGVVFSTGDITATQYNLQLGLVTAQLLKQQFISEFGNPDYTVGLGGSGGSIQQLIYAQNDSTLLDGILMTYAFPDLITQVNSGSDCALLEYYFDNLAYDAPSPWIKREFVEGLHASDHMKSVKLGLLNPKTALIRNSDGLGSDTCINGWGGEAPLALNPYYSDVQDIDQIKVSGPIHWTLWDNESNQWQYGTYPMSYDSFTYNTIGNEGVQYGLEALKHKHIGKKTFFDLNAKVGGWKNENEFQPEDHFPMSGPHDSYDGWSSKNATAQQAFAQNIIASRKSAYRKAIDAAEQSGTIFTGDIKIPIIELRNDKDADGDMHSAIQSFIIRARMQKYHRAGQHVLWLVKLSDSSAKSEHLIWQNAGKMASHLYQKQPKKMPFYRSISFADFMPEALVMSLMEDWIHEIKNNPKLSVADNKPFYIQDGCLSNDSYFPYFGSDVWDGIVDPNVKKGDCASLFTFYPTPRMVAGEDIGNNRLSCTLISIEQFIANGGYGDIQMSDDDILQLKKIFPRGVCKV